METIVQFHQLDAPCRWPGTRWVAELLDREGELPYPLAVAWLADFRETPLACVLLYFVLVPDHLRRAGHATALIEACRERWPDLELTEAISASGEGLLGSLESPTREE